MQYISAITSEFHDALRFKDLRYLKSFKLKYHLNMANVMQNMLQEHIPPFVYCIRKNDPDYNDILLNLLPASLEQTNKLKHAYLHEAAAHHNIYALDLLLKNGIDINARDYNGCTALHVAAHVGDHKIISKLIDFGASINIVSVVFSPSC